MKLQPLELLYRSFDSELTAEQKKELDLALAASEELRAEKEQALSLRSALADSRSEFRPFFETRVLERIRSELPDLPFDRMVDSLTVMFRRVAIAGAFCALILAAVNLTGADDISVESLFVWQDEPVEIIFQTPYEQVME